MKYLIKNKKFPIMTWVQNYVGTFPIGNLLKVTVDKLGRYIIIFFETLNKNQKLL